MLEAGELAIPGLSVDPARETWTYQRAFDGSYELEYAYESADGDPTVLFVSTLAYLEPKASDAEWVYLGAGLGVGLAEGDGVALIETPGLLTWGDEQTCKVFQTEGMTVGTLCIARKGPRVYVASVVGAVFDEPGSMDALLAAQLAAFDAWDPADP